MDLLAMMLNCLVPVESDGMNLGLLEEAMQSTPAPNYYILFLLSKILPVSLLH